MRFGAYLRKPHAKFNFMALSAMILIAMMVSSQGRMRLSQGMGMRWRSLVPTHEPMMAPMIIITITYQ